MSFPRYSKYKETAVQWLDAIPEHWTVIPLKRVSTIKYGIGEPPAYHPEGTPLIRATNIHAGRLFTEGLVFVDPLEIPAQRILWLDAGDIIVVRSGAYTGDSAIIPEGFGACIAGFDMVMKFCGVHAPFIQFALLSPYLKDRQIDLEKMRAAQPHLNAEELGGCVVVLPTTSEQRRIAAFLDRETAKIDALVAEQRRLIELLKEKRQAVISHAVTKGLNPTAKMKPSGIQWLGDVPEHWTTNPLKRSLDFVTSGSRGWAGNYADLGELFIRIGNLTRDSINLDLSDIQRVQVPAGVEGERTKVRPGDILFSVTAYLGSVAVVPENIESAYVSQHVALTRLRLGVGLEPRWVGYLALSFVGKTWFELQAYGGTKIQLSLDDIKELPITTPPEAEQIRILDDLERRLNEFQELTTEAERASISSKNAAPRLISAAVTGKIDVRNISEGKRLPHEPAQGNQL